MIEPDEVCVEGLSVLLDDEIEPPALQLRLRARGREFVAVILLAEEEWVVNLRDAAGRQRPLGEEGFVTQSGAILAAMLGALELAREPHLY